MKKVKVILWIIIIAIFGVVIFQNQGFFLSHHSLGIDLYFFSYRTAELPNVVLFAAFLLIGWLLAYIFGLADRFRFKATIKALRQTTTGQQTAIDSLKNDISALKTEIPSSQRRLDKTVDPTDDMADPPPVNQD